MKNNNNTGRQPDNRLEAISFQIRDDMIMKTVDPVPPNQSNGTGINTVPVAIQLGPLFYVNVNPDISVNPTVDNVPPEVGQGDYDEASE